MFWSETAFPCYYHYLSRCDLAVHAGHSSEVWSIVDLAAVSQQTFIEPNSNETDDCSVAAFHADCNVNLTPKQQQIKASSHMRPARLSLHLQENFTGNVNWIKLKNCFYVLQQVCKANAYNTYIASQAAYRFCVTNKAGVQPIGRRLSLYPQTLTYDQIALPFNGLHPVIHVITVLTAYRFYL